MDIQPITTEETVTAERPWLLSLHGSETNKTVTLDLSAFTEDTHWIEGTPLMPQRRLKSGIPLGRITASGLYGPYTTGASNGTQVFAGLLATETAYNPTSTRVGAAMIVHGDVDVAKLPVAFTVPAAGSRTDGIVFSDSDA